MLQPMSTAVLRRYTPPTCTLEIAATGSALSRWTDRQVLKNLRFRLSFDDPALPPEQQVQIRGDRTQLETLCDTVSIYVQQLLEADAPRTMPALLRLSPDTPPLVPSPTNGSMAEAERTTLQEETVMITPSFGTANGSSSIISATSGIALHPRGLLSHELHLGSLATPESGPVLRLNTTQLFDLANSLDNYTSDAVALPTLARPAWAKPTGALKAAAALVLAVGATATLARFVTNVSQTAPVVTSAPEALSASPPAPAMIPGVPNQDLTSLPPPPPAGSIATQPFPSPAAAPGTIPDAAKAPVPGAPLNPNLLPPNPVLPAAPETQTVPVPPSAIARAPQVAPQPAPDNAPFFRSAPSTLRAPTAEEFAGSGAASAPAAVPVPEAGIASTDVTPSAIARSNQFGSIPQLQEAQNYFRQRWQPPSTLDQALEYRLVVAPDGTIARIVPLGQLSGDYVDRTGIPLVGDPFVSPIDDGKTALIRLVLSPDGQVQTFLEGLN